ncbi:nickel pincer cofactor biosynthesis protein LarC [Methanosphaera sp. ISO3-F5]|uniref:nickel pincer cofactor biosynthesis protein LarC n=1 Tax=Methanosphaera sp. ISO3-F5 TaxID=1452353 RepID=UPI002B262CCE|nr:nickel pincer cofactor biosynthesis protein LarC [Methanosphaera sp. ISO3-F5]WQH64550.1 nickel pincer cofactor biosynthesis protein LarC [Methanosphaera sp. ISO3-F5]
MVVVIDPQVSGLAGNMFIGAFIDLGADKTKIEKVILDYAQEFGQIKVDINKKSKSGVMTTFASIETEDNSARHYPDIINKLEEITEQKYQKDETVNKSIALAKKIFRTLADAESKVHEKSIEELHFHEVGCADAVADIIGASYAYHLLGFDEEKIYSLPVATGNGSVNTQHGILPVPAPAVINILENVPTIGGEVNTELATPTGSAILVNIVDEYVTSTPLLTNKIIGYGSGKKDLKVLNALRIIKSEDFAEQNTITILETNIDTLSGEILGNLYDKLLDEGARDVTITPTIMKKNRPAHIVKVISRNGDAEHLVSVLMEETGTLGVRMLPHIHRGVAIRENVIHKVEVNGNLEEIRFKIGQLGDKIIKCSPEYDDLKKLSDKTGIPVKDLKSYVEQDYKKEHRSDIR